MKRLDLIQLTIIIAGIISVFFCLGLFPKFLIFLFSWFSDGLRGGYLMEAFIENILLLSCYLLFFLFSVRNSKQLAEWLGNKANLHAEINFSLDKTALLLALFLGLGIYGLIKELPMLVSDIYNYARESSTRLLETPDLRKPEKDVIFMQLTKVGLYLVLVIYARVFAAFFSARINNPDPVDEINTETE